MFADGFKELNMGLNDLFMKEKKTMFSRGYLFKSHEYEIVYYGVSSVLYAAFVNGRSCVLD